MHGDQGTKPLITTATDSRQLFQASGSSRIGISNLAFSNTATTRAAAIAATSQLTALTIDNCSFVGFTGGTTLPAIDGFTKTISNIAISRTEISNSTNAVIMSGAILSCTGCYIHDNTNGFRAISSPAVAVVVSDSIFANNSGFAVGGTTVGGIEVLSSDFTGNGEGVQSPTGLLTIWNSIFYSNTTGINNSANTAALAGGYNAYGGTGTPTVNFPAGPGDVSLSANPFTTATNFALNSTAGGGAALKTVGFPATFGTTTTAKPDIGAVQSACSCPTFTGCAVACVQ